MADLTDLQSAQTVKIAGAPSSGIEDNFMDVDGSGRITVKLNDASGNAINLGQAVMASSIPVVLASNQSAIPVTQSGSWSVLTPSFPTTVDTNYGAVGANTIRTASQFGNATGSALFGAGTTTAQVLRVVLPTDQTAIPATQSGTWNITNISGAISLPTGAATSALQTTGNTSLASIDTKTPTLGQKTMANSSPITIASDQSAIPVTQSGAWAVTANQGSANATPWNQNLSQVGGSAITLGQKTSANSIPVVLPSDQTITVTSSPLPATGSKFSFGQITTSALTLVPVEATTYTEVTTNSTMTIVSSSANDTAAGTGARSVTVTYLDQTMAGPSTVTVNLNGTTPVSLTSGMCYIEKIVVATVGSGGTNAGTLTLKTGGAATVGTVGVGSSQTFWAHHYVPTGKTCFISGFSFGNNSASAGAGGMFILKAGTPTVANTPDIQVSDFCTSPGAASTDTRSYTSPIQVAGPARIRAVVTPYATSTVTQFASFDFIDN